jgi:hypothetical protein
VSIHQNRTAVFGDRRKHGTSTESIFFVRPMHALNESKPAKHMLRYARRCLSDGDAIALSGAILETRRDELLGYAVARGRRGDTE